MSTAQPDMDIGLLDKDVDDVSVQEIVRSLLVSDRCVEEIRTTTAQDEDPTTSRVRHHIIDGWPHITDLDEDVRPFHEYRSQLNLLNGLVAFKERLVVPAACRPKILEHLHAGHLGIDKVLRRAKQAVWWPSISRDVDEY